MQLGMGYANIPIVGTLCDVKLYEAVGKHICFASYKSL